MIVEDVTILSTTQVYNGGFITWFQADKLAEGAEPGQFVMIHCAVPGGQPMFARAFSYHLIDENRFAIHYKVVGKGTGWLVEQEPGVRVRAYGPLGNSFSLPAGKKGRLLLIGGGVGIAPMPWFADVAVSRGFSVTAMMGAKTQSQLLPPHHWRPEVDYLPVTEDGSQGLRGFVTDHLTQRRRSAQCIYACGPRPMYLGMAAALRSGRPYRRGVEILEEDNMPCGWGMCYGCAVFTKQGSQLICKAGPRFDLFDIY